MPPDLGYSPDASTLLERLQVATLAYLFVIYGRTLVRWKRGEVTARALAPAVLLLTLAAWALIPANSSDTLEYLGFGRLFGAIERHGFARCCAGDYVAAGEHDELQRDSGDALGRRVRFRVVVFVGEA